MKTRLNEIIKDQTGSSLAFVLIIGMIIMIMVASLLAVANSDFTFTQETVESRQAYIDAKSVIEFGKIEINSRMKRLDDINNAIAIEAAKQDGDITELENDRMEAIDKLDDPYIIYGEVKNVANTLTTESTGENTIRMGEISFENYKFSIITEGLKRKLDYSVDFNYTPTTVIPSTEIKVPVDTPFTGDWNRGMIKNNGNKVSANFEGLGGDKDKDEDEEGVLYITHPDNNLNVSKGFGWLVNRVLNLTAKNICITNPVPTAQVNNAIFNMTALGELRFKETYQPNSKKKSTFKASTIVFEKKLVVEDKTTLEIDCETLFIKDDLILKAEGAKLNIKAKNVVISGDVTLEKGATMIFDCQNIWVSGNIKILSSGTTLKNNVESPKYALNYFNSGDVFLESGTQLEIIGSTLSNQIIIGDITFGDSAVKFICKNANYIETGDINLGSGTQLNITGIPEKANNQMISGVIKPKSYDRDKDLDKSNSSIETTTAVSVSISDFASFTCNGLILDKESTLNLRSEIVRIKADLILYAMKAPIDISTQYLDITGQTYIGKTQGEVNLSPIDGTLNVRFNAGYSQFYSIVNIISADKAVFSGPNFYLKGDSINNLTLNVKANDIYLDTDNIQIKQYYGSTVSRFFYSGKKNDVTTNLHMKSSVIWKKLDWPEADYKVQSGDYNAVRGQFPKVEQEEVWLYDVEPVFYHGPEWENVILPLIPGSSGGAGGSGSGSGSGGTSVIVTPGSVGSGLEKYY